MLVDHLLKSTLPLPHKGLDITDSLAFANAAGTFQTALIGAKHFVSEIGISDADRKEMKETFNLMKENGLLALPFPLCTFEKRVVDINFIVLACGGKEFDLSFYWSYGPPKNAEWFASAGSIRMVAEGWEYRGYDWFAEHTPSGHYLNLVHNAAALTREFIVLLMTKGTRVDPIPHGKTKAKLIDRAAPVDAHHVIRIYDSGEKGQSRGKLGERYRTRFHHRRAHNRTQHYGRHNAKVKDILIEAVWVGYREEGTITSEYELTE
jgi:hypothetical protein